MFNRVAVGAEDDALCSFLLDCLHTSTTGDKVRDVGFFIPVVMVEMECPVVVKTTAGTA